MTQEIILQKFTQYLNFKQQELRKYETSSEFKELDPLKRQKIDLEHKQAQLRLSELEALIESFFITRDGSIQIKGHCVGLSLCYSSMAVLGEEVLAWWESVLCAIAAWDESEAELAKPIETLPKLSHEESKVSNLDGLLTKAIDYVKFHQDFYMEGPHLQPKTGVYELLANDGKTIRKVIDRQAAAGNFTDAQLECLLEEKNIEGRICLLKDADHAISLIYLKKQKKWQLYDPNYLHDKESIHKVFDSKNDLIKEVRRVLGDSIVVEVASLTGSQPSQIDKIYESMIDSSTMSLISHFGLHVIAWNAPALLEKVLDCVAKAHDRHRGIADALAKKTANAGWTGLHLIARYAPAVLGKALDYAARADGHKFIVRALAEKTVDKGLSGFQMIARYAPAALEKALDYAAIAPDGHKYIASALVEKTKRGDWSGLYMIARYAPAALEKALDYAAITPYGQECIARALAEKTATGWTGLHVIAMYAPAVLEKAFDYAAKTPDGLTNIVKALFETTTSPGGWSGLRMIIEYVPSQLSKVFDILSRAKNGGELILKLLMEKNGELNHWQIIKNQLSCVQRHRLKKRIINNFNDAIRDSDTAKNLNKLFEEMKEKPEYGHFFYKAKCSGRQSTRLSSELSQKLNQQRRFGVSAA